MRCRKDNKDCGQPKSLKVILLTKEAGQMRLRSQVDERGRVTGTVLALDDDQI